MDQNEVLAGSLADSVLADAILNSSPPTVIKKVRGLRKVRKLVTEKLSNKKGDVGMAKCFSNKTLGRALDPHANGTWLSKLTRSSYLRRTDN